MPISAVWLSIAVVLLLTGAGGWVMYRRRRGDHGIVGIDGHRYAGDNHRMSYRAVCTDLDGTVVHDGRLSPVTLEAMAALREIGIPLIAVTARTPAGIRDIESLMEHLTIAVCCAGAVGLDGATDRMLWRETFDAGSVDQIVRFAMEELPNAGIATHDGEHWSMTPKFDEERGASRRGLAEVVPHKEIGNREVCLMSICDAKLSSDELMVTLARAGLDPLPTITYSTYQMVDVSPTGVDKRSGLKRALSLLDIDPADAVAFGDMPNDLPMFALCGHPIAVANAHPDVLAAASAVTDCVHDDGFARHLAGVGLVALEYRTVSAKCNCTFA